MARPAAWKGECVMATALYKQCDAFTSERYEDVLLLRFADHPFIFNLDMTAKNRFVECLESVSRDDRIKAVILFGRPEKIGRREFTEFFDKAVLPQADRCMMHKMFNIFNQFIMTVMELNKFVISVSRGRLVSQMFFASLACDYRILAESTVVQNAFLDADMPPKGAGAFFLPHFVSRRTAYELMIAEEDITADRLLRLGLVDEVAPEADLEQASLHAAQKFAAAPGHALAGIKKLLNYQMLKELEGYLEFENQEVLKAFNAAKLRVSREGKL